MAERGERWCGDDAMTLGRLETGGRRRTNMSRPLQSYLPPASNQSCKWRERNRDREKAATSSERGAGWASDWATACWNAVLYKNQIEEKGLEKEEEETWGQCTIVYSPPLSRRRGRWRLGWTLSFCSDSSRQQVVAELEREAGRRDPLLYYLTGMMLVPTDGRGFLCGLQPRQLAQLMEQLFDEVAAAAAGGRDSAQLSEEEENRM